MNEAETVFAANLAAALWKYAEIVARKRESMNLEKIQEESKRRREELCEVGGKNPAKLSGSDMLCYAAHAVQTLVEIETEPNPEPIYDDGEDKPYFGPHS